VSGLAAFGWTILGLVLGLVIAAWFRANDDLDVPRDE
jgi:hypothetical protein